jgi:hypothetical protein
VDLKLDETTHDCVFINGPLTASGITHPFTETVGQRLKIMLLTYMGEWFWDTTYGIPYYQRLLGIKQTSKASIDLIFNQKILEEPGVKEIVSFKSTFVNRVYSLTFQVKVVDGTITSPIVVGPLN